MSYLASLYGLKETVYELSSAILRNSPQDKNPYPNGSLNWVGGVLLVVSGIMLIYFLYRSKKKGLR